MVCNLTTSSPATVARRPDPAHTTQVTLDFPDSFTCTMCLVYYREANDARANEDSQSWKILQIYDRL